MRVHPFIEAEKTAGKGIERACRLLEVSRSAFYARRKSPSKRAVADATLTIEIRQRSGVTRSSCHLHRVRIRCGSGSLVTKNGELTCFRVSHGSEY